MIEDTNQPEVGSELFPAPPEVEGMPAEGMPQEGMPAEGMPAEGMPMEGMPAEGMPMESEDTLEGELDVPSVSEVDAQTDASKKILLQKLMSNLLDKPGRSLHELISGIKEVIGAYKNYAKEYDNLNGVVSSETAPSDPSAAGSKEDLKNIISGGRGQ